jgi:DsbE subfamily thiol:disulfide oxidoreductase
MTRIRWVTTVVFVVVIALGVLLAVNLGGDPTKLTNATVGHQAPQFKLAAFDQTSIDLSSLRGRVVLVNFWNEWCAPCIEEMPDLQRLAAAHANDPGFVLVGIVHDANSRGAARAYATKNKMTWPLAFDPDSRVALDYGVTGQPESFLVDKAGTVNRWVSGPIDYESMERSIATLEAT